MFAEKLLLQILIVITPILLYLVIFEDKRFFKSPYLYGSLQGISAILCMLFSYQSFGLNWDLRYIPLILSIFYGGPIAGRIAVGMFITIRLLIGGELLLLGIGSCLISLIIPIVIGKKFLTYSPKKRIRIVLFSALWTMLISATIFLATCMDAIGNMMPIDIILFGLLFIVGNLLAAKLIELAIERVQLKASIQRSEKLNILGELAASVAHEVRNPLTVVKGFLQLMKQKDNAKEYEYLSLILSELGRAETIINDYLNFAKPQFNKLEEVSLVDIIKEVIFLLDPLAAKQGVILSLHFDKANPFIYTDRNQLKQALVNFVKNAIEATNAGGQVSVEIILREDNLINVLIKDTGKGMNHEQLTRMGTLFYTTKDKGTGLGTTVSMKIIETMNGKVQYKSIPGIGTEVTLILPMLRKESEPVIA
jgi:two-component system, sporulation sensor kinase B